MRRMWFEESGISPDGKDLFSQKLQGNHSASWHYPGRVRLREAASLPEALFSRKQLRDEPKGTMQIVRAG